MLLSLRASDLMSQRLPRSGDACIASTGLFACHVWEKDDDNNDKRKRKQDQVDVALPGLPLLTIEATRCENLTASHPAGSRSIHVWDLLSHEGKVLRCGPHSRGTKRLGHALDQTANLSEVMGRERCPAACVLVRRFRPGPVVMLQQAVQRVRQLRHECAKDERAGSELR
ncbi:hypothetical protein BCR34DRAFT_590908 [Clohesyomyces aquaticus]|uniref:Uncharacterized protein n=1 Tax=Clohesyomyces aquaticus TaxID=1231657 RepID=A0A1Y1Z5K2_9PLEO|nr:hypothetical protein BCR34DRAFT_590908 [Clohesyomyces aquaticus]